MKKYYVLDTATKFYAGAILCRDEKKPENSTEVKPLPFKANNEIVCNGDAWAYQPMNEENE